MKLEELKSLSLNELNSKEEELSGEMFNLKVQIATGKLENPMRLRVLRRNIARIKTLAREKGIASAGKASAK